jgi:hypothetical protein
LSQTDSKKLLVSISFLDRDPVEDALDCRVDDMPEELKKLTPPLREFRGVIVPLQGDLKQIRQSYRKHGVNLQFAADYIERRRKSARKAKQLGLDARPYMLRCWCGKCQADLIAQFGETPICLSCASVPSKRELQKIFSFEGVIARSLRRDIPRNHADLVQEIYMTLPWHVPVESDEKPPSPWLLDASFQKWRARTVTLTFGIRVRPNKARRVFLHEVGHLFTTGDGERIKKDPTHILRQELEKFNAYALRKRSEPSYLRLVPPELLADAYSLYATNEFPKRRFPKLHEYMQTVFQKEFTAQQLDREDEFVRAIHREQMEEAARREREAKKKLVAELDIRVEEDPSGQRWTMHFKADEIYKIVPAGRAEAIDEVLQELAALKLRVYVPYIDIDYDFQDDEIIVAVEPAIGIDFEEARRVFAEDQCTDRGPNL